MEKVILSRRKRITFILYDPAALRKGNQRL